MATTSVPTLLPANDQLGLITGYIEVHGSSTNTSTVTSFETVYYTVPFFIWFVIAYISVFLMARITIEFIKRWKHQP